MFERSPAWLRWSLGTLLVVSGCTDDVPTVTTANPFGTGDTGSITTFTSTTDAPTTEDQTTDVASGGQDTTAGPGSTSSDTGIDSTEGTTAPTPTCGDDFAEGDEDCDGSDLLGEDCLTLGFDAGRLSCAADCTFDDSGCVMWSCGNDLIEGMETCDGNDLDGEDCLTLGFDAGTLGCGGTCRDFDTTGCITFSCGNDLIEGIETCDGTDLDGQDCLGLGFDAGTLDCAGNCLAYDTTGCITFSCGNDLIEGMETCDGTDLDGEECLTLGFDAGTLDCAGNCLAYDTSGCVIFGGDCCVDNGTPGCDDPTCTADVCAADAFCCDTQWDGICANAAFTLCPAVCDNCGDGTVNSPVEVCDGPDLLGEDCLTQGFDAGTLGCAADCSALDTSACSTFSGDCCSNNGTPGCDDPTCTADVCAADPFCCDNSWDGICADAAFTLCPVVCDNCGDNTINSPVEACDGLDLAGQDCITQGFTGGVLGCAADCSALDTAACTLMTCGNDLIEGVEVCDGADLGGQDCITQGFAGGTLACALDCAALDTSACTTGSDCCADNGSPGCDNMDCQDAICAADPFCCSNTWDGICAADAATQCGVCLLGTCSHGLCDVGDALLLGCDPCVDLVCAADAFCCDNSWDAICVGNVGTNCSVTPCP